MDGHISTAYSNSSLGFRCSTVPPEDACKCVLGIQKPPELNHEQVARFQPGLIRCLRPTIGPGQLNQVFARMTPQPARSKQSSQTPSPPLTMVTLLTAVGAAPTIIGTTKAIQHGQRQNMSKQHRGRRSSLVVSLQMSHGRTRTAPSRTTSCTLTHLPTFPRALET